MRKIGLGLILVLGCGGRTTQNDGGDAGEDTSTSGEDDTTTSTSGDTSDSSSSEDETDTGETDEGTAFVPPGPDAGDEFCDVWDPDSCPDGEKCTAVSTQGGTWDAHKCVPIMGDGEPGDDCMALGEMPGLDGLDDCGAGAMCWNVDKDTGIGVCRGFCEGSPNDPECPEMHVCPIYGDGVITICLPTCDPLQQGADCPDNTPLCLPFGDNFMCAFASDNAGYGEECQFATACAPGLVCVNAEIVPDCQGDGCCTEWCDTSQPNTCIDAGKGAECLPWWEMGMAPPGFEDLGVCGLP